ncbi:MAG: Asp-tRNA(Asn)/Glu-tRNA(Gln) amidotransferase subunit GatC [Patescibacteria group bacterium]
MEKLSKKTLEYLAGLARIELDKKGEDKLLRDLQKIFDYFEELKEVNTENVESMTGGNIFSENVFREDIQNLKLKAKNSKLIEVFPEEKDGFLKVPPVFE